MPFLVKRAICNKLRFCLIVICIFLFSGCAFIFGTQELTLPDESIENCISTQPETKNSPNENVFITINYIGESRPLITARNIFGGIMRYVVPYTHETILFEINIENNSNSPISINNEDIILETQPSSTKQSPLNLNFFKEAWPSFSVSNDVVLLDRAEATSYVIRTIFYSTKLLPQTKIKKILPFMKWPEDTKEVKIVIKNILINNQAKEAIFEFKCGDI